MTYTPAVAAANVDQTWTDGGAITMTDSGGTPLDKPDTVAKDKVYYHRVGNTLFAKYDYYQNSATGANNGAGGTWLFTLPGSLAFDSSEIGTIPSSSVDFTATPVGQGHASITYGGVTYFYTLKAFPYNTTQFWVLAEQGSGSSTTSFASLKTNSNFIIANPFLLYIEIEAPISTW